MKVLVSVSVCILVFARLQVEGRTICYPLSRFRDNCNVCICSKDGTQYSCTDRKCDTIPYEKLYDEEITEDGHRLLVPKKNNIYTSSDDDGNFEIGDPSVRTARESFPFVDDEIPSSKEDDDDDDDEDSDNDDDKALNGNVDNEVNDERDALDTQKDLIDEEKRINLSKFTREVDDAGWNDDFDI